MPDQAEQIITDLQRENAFLRNRIKAQDAGQELITEAVNNLFITSQARGTTPNQPNFIDKASIFDRIDYVLQLLNPLVRRG